MIAPSEPGAPSAPGATDARAGPIPVEVDDRLAEETVLLASRGRLDAPFWSEREALYGIAPGEERERRFRELHRREFAACGLDRPLRRALGEQPVLRGAVDRCRVVPARKTKEEGAELLVVASGEESGPEPSNTAPPPPRGGRPARTIAIRLRPASLLAPEALLGFLRHELFHVADMVDPTFGYDPSPPEVEGGPLALRLVLERYRVLWDTVIDGRLSGQGRTPPSIRDFRRREFAAAFPMLGAAREAEFERWFAIPSPAHAALLRYAVDPAATAGVAPASPASGTCPLCRCPGALLQADGAGLPRGLAAAVRADFPEWDPSKGLCRLCAERYSISLA